MKRLAIACAVCLLALPALADDLALDQAQSLMLQSSARYYLMLSQKLQAAAAETAAKDAATAKFWAAYVAGLKHKGK